MDAPILLPIDRATMLEGIARGFQNFLAQSHAGQHLGDLAETLAGLHLAKESLLTADQAARLLQISSRRTFDRQVSEKKWRKEETLGYGEPRFWLQGYSGGARRAATNRPPPTSRRSRSTWWTSPRNPPPSRAAGAVPATTPPPDGLIPRTATLLWTIHSSTLTTPWLPKHGLTALSTDSATANFPSRS